LKSLLYLSFWKASENSGESPEFIHDFFTINIVIKQKKEYRRRI